MLTAEVLKVLDVIGNCDGRRSLVVFRAVLRTKNDI